jgi:hypothetical protein
MMPASLVCDLSIMRATAPPWEKPPTTMREAGTPEATSPEMSSSTYLQEGRQVAMCSSLIHYAFHHKGGTALDEALDFAGEAGKDAGLDSMSKFCAVTTCSLTCHGSWLHLSASWHRER